MIAQMTRNQQSPISQSSRVEEFVAKMNKTRRVNTPVIDLNSTRLYYKFPEIAEEMLDTAIELFTHAGVTHREQNVILRFADSFARQPELIQEFRRLPQHHRDAFLEFPNSMHELCLIPYLAALRLAGNPPPKLRNNLVNSVDLDTIDDPVAAKYLLAITDVRLAKAVQSYSATKFLRGIEFVFTELEKVYEIEVMLHILDSIESLNLDASPMDVIRLIHSWDSLKELPFPWALSIAPELTFES